MLALGASVVYEAEPQAFDRSALERSQANVVVVNLDARNDADLDNVYELLDDVRYRVVFNDDEVSGGLTGWDQARWMRHLAAKILDDANIDPPRPEGAEAVPVHISTTAMSTAAADGRSRETVVGAPVPAAAPIGAGNAGQAGSADPAASLPASPVEYAASAATIDFDPMVDIPDASRIAPPWSALDPPTTAPASTDSALQQADDHTIDAVDLSGFDDIGLDFDAPTSPVPPPLPAAPDSLADTDFDLDSLDFELPATAGPVPVSTAAAPLAEHDFDMDSSAFDTLDRAAPSPGPAVVDTPEQGIDFDSFEFDSVAASGVESAFDFGAETEPQIEADSAAAPASESATADLASTTADDEVVLDEAPTAPSIPAGAPAFGIEKVRAEEFLAPDVEANEAHPFEVPQGLSLELIPLDEAVAPIPMEVASRENWLDPDAVQPKVRRIWVLGASIGGPEAVREFLAALPRGYPALFVLAQHLGDEFVDMMAKQLAQATALTVRTPTHGERVGHGEVVIVPNGKRLLIDPMGVVVLERDAEERAFSPSIDRVLRDIADRFGSNAGAIVFSGMTDDAVEGCQYLAQKGGVIYAQSQDTCVVSTMIDGVCAAGIVKFQGSPQQLAEKLIAG